MAQRRMFSKAIINSARFLKMPAESQNLYFHLGLRADDDGIVEAYTVMKLIGTSDDNLKILAAKGYVRILNEDMVSFIVDWKEHNLIRADRKVDSIYKNLLLQMLPEVELQEPVPRADTGKKTGQKMDVQCQHRIGEDRIGKVSSDKDMIDDAIVKIKYMDHVYLTKEEYEELINSYHKEDIDSKIASLNCYIANKDYRYSNKPSHYAIIIKWLVSDVMAGKVKTKPKATLCPACLALGIKTDITGRQYCPACDARKADEDWKNSHKDAV